MTGRRYADDVCMCGQHADDIPACGRRPDDVCHPPPEISNEVSLSCRPHVIRASSARRLHVVRPSYARDFSSQTISS